MEKISLINITTPHGSQTDPNSLCETIATLRGLLEKATAGPWDDDVQDKNGQIIITGCAMQIEIATCWHHCVGELEEQMKANAALIVALRNNAEALLNALETREGEPSEIADRDELVDTISDAITDSMDADWTSRVGARVIATRLIASHAIRFTKP